MSVDEQGTKMTGNSLNDLVKSNPTVARANSIVNLINQAAALLRSFRANSGISQTEMAEKLGVSQPRIAQLESGKPDSVPSLEQIAEYAFHTGNSVSIYDKAKSCDEMERDRLHRKIKELQALVRELQRSKEIEMKEKKLEIGFDEITFTRKEYRNQFPKVGAVIPVSVRAATSAKGHPTLRGHAVVVSKGTEVPVARVKDLTAKVGTLYADLLTGKWDRVVSKGKLKTIAHSIERSANDQKTRAYDVLRIVTDAIDVKSKL